MRTERKKILWIIYTIFIFFCCFVFVFFRQKSSETVVSENYGNVKDSSIELDKGTEVCVEFTINQKNFMGISVRFESSREFQDEDIKASLYDKQSGELISETTIQLKYELIRNSDSGSYIFFPFTFSDEIEMNGRSVRVLFEIEGDTIYTTPKFILSSTCLNNSLLYINDEMSDMNLFFTAKYKTNDQVDTTIVMNILVVFLAGTLVFIWAYSSKSISKVEISKKEHQSKILDKISKKKKLGLLVSFSIIVFFLMFYLLYVYEFHIERVTDRQEVVDVFTESADSYFEIDNRIEQISQTFTAEKNYLSSVIIPFVFKEISDNARINVKVLDLTSGQFLTEKTLNLSDYENGESKEVYIYFNEIATDISKHIVSVNLSFDNFSDSIIKIKLSTDNNIDSILKTKISDKETEDSSLTINGISSMYNLALKIERCNTSYLFKLYLVFCIAVLLFVSVIFWCIFRYSVKIETLYPIFVLALGIGIGLVIPIYGVPDEPSHIDTAYAVSNMLLRVPDSEKPGYIYKRIDDIDMYAENKKYIDEYSYADLDGKLFSKVKNDTLVECGALSNLNNAGVIFYLPQAIGLSIGRLLKLGTLPMLLLGRLCNLICYTLLCVIAIRKIPVAKISLIIISLLPISLQQAASFSYDALINGISFVLIGYNIYIIYTDNEISTWDIIVLLIGGGVLASTKGGVYLPICIIPFYTVFMKKKYTGRQRIILSLVACFSICIFINQNLVSTLTRLLKKQGEVTGGSTSTELYTLGYFLQYPRRLIGIAINTIYVQGDEYLKNILGGKLSWMNIEIPWLTIVLILLILTVSCINYNKSEELSIPSRIWIGCIAVISFSLVEISMLFAWTPSTSHYIRGVQGRYLLPVFPLVIMAMSNSLFKSKIKLDKYLVFGLIFLDNIVLLQILQQTIK